MNFRLRPVRLICGFPSRFWISSSCCSRNAVPVRLICGFPSRFLRHCYIPLVSRQLDSAFPWFEVLINVKCGIGMSLDFRSWFCAAAQPLNQRFRFRAMAIIQFKDSDLRQFTRDFSETRTLGKPGAFGQVYKGKVRGKDYPNCPRRVAIKKSKIKSNYVKTMWQVKINLTL